VRSEPNSHDSAGTPDRRTIPRGPRPRPIAAIHAGGSLWPNTSGD
jgi:hypothetical protein